MEIFWVFVAAFSVFLVLFLVFAIKRRETGEPVRIHNCQNCGCADTQTGHLERFRRQARRDGGGRPGCGDVPDPEGKGESSLTSPR